jgi:hypothetical protein
MATPINEVDYVKLCLEPSPHNDVSDETSDDRDIHLMYVNGMPGAHIGVLHGCGLETSTRVVAAVNACSGISAHDLTRFPPGTIAAILPKLKGQTQRIKDLEAALTAACASLKDASAGWPESEMHEPVNMTLQRCDRLIPGWDQ